MWFLKTIFITSLNAVYVLVPSHINQYNSKSLEKEWLELNSNSVALLLQEPSSHLCWAFFLIALLLFYPWQHHKYPHVFKNVPEPKTIDAYRVVCPQAMSSKYYPINTIQPLGFDDIAMSWGNMLGSSRRSQQYSDFFLEPFHSWERAHTIRLDNVNI